MDTQEASTFFSSLFDFSFQSFITSRIIRLLYVLSMVGAGLMYLMMIVLGFQISAGVGVLNLLIVGPIAFLLTIIYVRVILELIMVVFSIAENVRGLARRAPESPEPAVENAGSEHDEEGTV